MKLRLNTTAVKLYFRWTVQTEISYKCANKPNIYNLYSECPSSKTNPQLSNRFHNCTQTN